MNNRTEAMPAIVISARVWRPRLFRAAYIFACATAMFGWSAALSWAAFSFLRLLLS